MSPRSGVRVPLWVLGAAAVALLAVALGALALLGGQSLPERAGPPVEDLAVERTVLTPGTIELTLRNTGPDPVAVAQVFVNDAYVDFSGEPGGIERLRSETLRLDMPWQDGQPYLVSMVTSSGAVIEHEIPVAVATPQAGPGFFGVMALLGTYVGIVPVLLGMLLLPLLRRAGGAAVRMLLAVTVGLLAYLVIDGTAEGFELATSAEGGFGGPSLVVFGAVLAFLVLTCIDRWIRGRSDGGTAGAGYRLALMIAIGIGLHNLGEGLAIGAAYAVGGLALGTALVVGFALHNTTEGVAVVAPLAERSASGTSIGTERSASGTSIGTDRRPSVLRLLGLGLIAGAPAILGAVLGAGVSNAELSALLLGVGVGAIVQVIVQIAPSLRENTGGLGARTIGGLAVGVLLMYLTGLAVTA